MNVKKLIGTITIALLVVALSVSMAAALQGMINSADSTGAEVNYYIVGDEVYARGAGLGDCDENGLVDVYVVVDAIKPPEEIWVNGESINASDHLQVLVVEDVDPNDINVPGNGPLFLGTVVNKDLSGVNGYNEIPAPGDFDIIYDCNQDGYFDVNNDTVDYSICSGFRTDIPEFATPVIALLGLVFFMRRKKD